MIQFNNVYKDYQSPDGSVIRLTFPDLRLTDGEQVAVTGPSGSGKSTLLGLLAGLIEPTGGSITRMTRLAVDTQRRAAIPAGSVGIVFQELNLLPSLSVRENLLAAAWILRLGRCSGMIDTLLDMVGLEHRRHHLPHQLSRGEQQRAAVARAMLYPYPLVIADEPTASLDAENSHSVLSLLRTMAARNNSTLVVSTHDPAVIACFEREVSLDRPCWNKESA